RAGIAAAVAIDAVAELTVSLVLEQTLTEGGVLCRGRIKRQQKDRSPGNAQHHVNVPALMTLQPDRIAVFHCAPHFAHFRFPEFCFYARCPAWRQAAVEVWVVSGRGCGARIATASTSWFPPLTFSENR